LGARSCQGRQPPKASLYRTCHPAILGHRGRRLETAQPGVSKPGRSTGLWLVRTHVANALTAETSDRRHQRWREPRFLGLAATSTSKDARSFVQRAAGLRDATGGCRLTCKLRSSAGSSTLSHTEFPEPHPRAAVRCDGELPRMPIRTKSDSEFTNDITLLGGASPDQRVMPLLLPFTHSNIKINNLA
jgi:hypothetical protein